ncbi:MAG: hypothetical protein UV79_C0001G0052 [candidate division TM6 bacterium GW2011_GWF2_43_17]|nr:MAG: hypothetical protein UV79_C0001G0052 [candidate division TM6 bacterium GW2011_GWF2_43_17]HAU30312.1 hypothetical protein [Candidatus Dependentiae bacterium]
MKLSQKNKRQILGYLLPIVTALLLLGLLGIALQRYYKDSKTISSQLTAQTVEELAQIFKKIDNRCKIIDFEHEKNYVDFLTVERFVGSEVGSMNLTHAEKWEGPYLRDNPTIQEKYFVIIDTPKGYYLAPGDGVKLANNKVVGVDIILDKNTDFDALISDKDMLLFDGKPLAQFIKAK